MGVVELRYGRFTVAKEGQSIYKGHDSGGKMTRKRKKMMFVLIRTQVDIILLVLEGLFLPNNVFLLMTRIQL